MKKRFTAITALTMSSIIMMIALVGCNTSCNKLPGESLPENTIETSLIDGSAVAIIETEINGSKVTETSIINTTASASSSSQNNNKNSSETTKGSEVSNNDSVSTQATTTQATTESTQSNTKATSTPKPTATPKPTTGNPTNTPKPSATATPKPTSTPKPTNTPIPTTPPTNTPKPTNTPVPTATPEPTATPTPEPTEAPTEPEPNDPPVPDTGYAIIKVKATANIYVDDESTETYQVVEYYEVEGFTSNYHSTTPSDYHYSSDYIADQLEAKYGENLKGYSSKVAEVVSFTN